MCLRSVLNRLARPLRRSQNARPRPQDAPAQRETVPMDRVMQVRALVREMETTLRQIERSTIYPSDTRTESGNRS